jgi:hypothetical protein
MYEDLSRVIGNGFGTWRDNLILCIPFLVGAAFAIIVGIVSLILIFSLNPESFQELGDASLEMGKLTFGEIVSVAERNPVPFVILLITVLAEAFVDSFFRAGAVGMARQATVEMTTTSRTMWAAGRRFAADIFFVRFILGFIMLAGLVLIVPGLIHFLESLGVYSTEDLAVLNLDTISEALTAFDPQVVSSLFLGLSLFIIYLLTISLLFAVVFYAVVLDDLGPIAAIRSAINFFRSNLFDVFIIWLTVMALSLSVGMVGQLFANNPSAASAWSFFSVASSLVVIEPLSTVWWTRLYMSRTGKKLQEDDQVKYLW